MIADLNADGRKDLLSDSLLAYLGDGSGTFTALPYFPISRIGKALADFDGDGILDLTDALTTYRGRGDGRFEPAPALPFGEFVVSADFNEDGLPDLATTTLNVRSLGGRNVAAVYLATAAGAFSEPRILDVAGAISRLVAGDFDGDGLQDLVFSHYFLDSVSVVLSRPGRTFAPETAYLAGDGPLGLAVADLNGDGHSDLAVANLLSQDVSIYPGLGGGTLDPQSRTPAGGEVRFLAAGDFTGDGRTDLAVAVNFESGGNAVNLLPGRADGS